MECIIIASMMLSVCQKSEIMIVGTNTGKSSGMVPRSTDFEFIFLFGEDECLTLLFMYQC